MSDVIKLNMKSRTLKVKIEGNSVQEDPERDRERLEVKHKDELRHYYENGFNEGQQSIKAQYESYYSDKLLQRYEDLHQMFSNFDRKIEVYENEFEKLVIETAFVIAEKIVKSEIVRNTIIRQVLQESLKRVLGANDVIVKLNPSDYNNLFSPENEITLDDSFAKIKFEKDERIENGGCLVETEIGNVDARISTQLTELKKHLDLNLFPPVVE